MASDEELLARYLRGDGGAFSELLNRHCGSVLGYLLKMVNDRQLAEDLFQETFSRVHQKAGKFRGKGRFKSWLFTIASHVVIDYWRKRSRRPGMISLDCDNDPDEQGNGGGDAMAALIEEKQPGPAQQVDLQEQRQRVQQAIMQLPERQRMTLVLAYYQQMSYQEVADSLNCSLGTVKTQMFRALKKLAELLPDLQGGAIQ